MVAIAVHLLDSEMSNTKSVRPNCHGITESGYYLITTIIKSTLDAKKIEWHKDPCMVLCNFVNVDDAWLYLVPYELQMNLSNLLDNAREARSANSNIIMNVINAGSEVIITITNFGTVIPENKIAAVMAGLSLKEGGHGIGLSGAKEYIESMNGTLSLTSSKIEGTTVSIKLPQPLPPKWAFNKDKFNCSQGLIVCNAVESELQPWQKYCSINGISNIQYFANLDMFNEWLAQQDDPTALIFMHHNFTGENIDALELLAVNNIKYACLVTDQIEDTKLQQATSKANYFLISQESVQKMLKSAIG